MTVRTEQPSSRIDDGIGESALRPDGIAKLKGEFEYAQDQWVEGMLWGATTRSPHPHARILSIDVAPALAIGGVHAVLTADDVPGRASFGLEHPDQPVLAKEMVNFWGEPVAIVAAEDDATARRAAAAVVVEYERLEPLTDPEDADLRDEVFRRMRIRRGDQSASGSVVVEGFYEVGMQDQAPLGTEAGLAVPDGHGGVDLYATSQFVHADHEQVVASLGLRPEQVRAHPTGIGGAFGAREDVNLHIHLCLLALHTSQPVKMVYHRSESFTGHVHRHPARMWYRHEADEDGNLVRVRAKVLIDGGAYASTTAAVLANACYFAVGPYNCESVSVDGVGTRTNNPPCGAMRGFGAVQVCFAHEAQMDRLADALGMDPLELRRKNALESGDSMPTTGQVIETPLPTVEVIDSLAAMPIPEESERAGLPGGSGLTTEEHHVVRGIGYAVGIKNLGFSEGFDDFAQARVLLTPGGAIVETAAIEVGQGLVTILAQIVRSSMGVSSVEVRHVDTSKIDSAGSTSASRQTQMSGGATLEASSRLRARILEHFAGDDLNDEGVWRDGELVVPMSRVTEDKWEETVTFRHPPTSPPDGDGQGVVHADFALAAHRAVVDVDPELGLVTVVRVDTAQDVGKALNPQSVVGQIEGGIMQGVGLAIMEELILDHGVIRNPNFTDYLLPTILDAPDVEALLIEKEGSWGPFGAKGVGEPPTISSTAAVAAAIRNATGRAINRVPVRPQDIAL
ncbi:MAG: molybdopterin-dependent oxidoreductase [Acidobacteria bacterium]|nr:molybdopterin-dependent oxidoreductase [Acidobacteriota bacterium]TDI52287.1 MAG: xanthine dehydrogenase subunit D [Acidobacteriota bacterium]